MYTLDSLQEYEYPILLEIWESSVKATHDFLKDGEIDNLKSLIQEHDIFHQANITCVRNSKGNIVGFMGISGKSLEMLFISPDVMGKGVGKMLMLHALENLGVTKVEVNEQNIHAAGFYKHFGFTVISRSELDGNGKPYPILHMECK